MSDTIEHEMYLDLESWPIALPYGIEYEIVRTVVVKVPSGKTVFRHLVREVGMGEKP